MFERLKKILKPMSVEPKVELALPETESCWIGDSDRAMILLRGEIDFEGSRWRIFLQDGSVDWEGILEKPLLSHFFYSFKWLRDLKTVKTENAEKLAQNIVYEFLASHIYEKNFILSDVSADRIFYLIENYSFLASTSLRDFSALFTNYILEEIRKLASLMAISEKEKIVKDQRELTLIKALLVASGSFVGQESLFQRMIDSLPEKINQQFFPDGSHIERSPYALLLAIEDLLEIRQFLQSKQIRIPVELNTAIERSSLVLKNFRHGDLNLSLFNSGKETYTARINQALDFASAPVGWRSSKPKTALYQFGGFYRMSVRKGLVLIDGGNPPEKGLDRFAHAGALSFEFSYGTERIIVNCGSILGSEAEWSEALRKTNAHSVLNIPGVDSSGVISKGLGRTAKVEASLKENGKAFWFDGSHDGFEEKMGVLYRRRLYFQLNEKGMEDLRGEESLDSPTPHKYTLRFHLHPKVRASLQPNGDVLLALESGTGWTMRADTGIENFTIEESIYLGGIEARKSEQIVLSGYNEGSKRIRWAITRIHSI